MSSWYVWAAIGLYPETPGTADLVLASPVFTHVSITLANGHRIEIDAPRASAADRYVQSAARQRDRGAGRVRNERIRVPLAAGGRRDLGRSPHPSPSARARIAPGAPRRDPLPRRPRRRDPARGSRRHPRRPAHRRTPATTAIPSAHVPLRGGVVSQLVEHHRRACDAFSRVTVQVTDAQWELPTPCPQWGARTLVEHVIGFHDFLLLRPLGVRANRPKTGPAARWAATSVALFAALDTPGTLDRETELPGGGTSSPRTMIGALTTDVLVHTWDLARAASCRSRTRRRVVHDRLRQCARRRVRRRHRDVPCRSAGTRRRRRGDAVDRVVRTRPGVARPGAAP